MAMVWTKSPFHSLLKINRKITVNHWQQWMPGFHRIFYGHRILLVPVNLTDLPCCHLTVIHRDLMMISCNYISSLRKFNGNFPLFNETLFDP